MIQQVQQSYMCVNVPNFYTGSGVFATKHFAATDFLLEYRGELLSHKDAEDRDDKYGTTCSAGSFMYYFETDRRQRMW